MVVKMTPQEKETYTELYREAYAAYYQWYHKLEGLHSSMYVHVCVFSNYLYYTYNNFLLDVLCMYVDFYIMYLIYV